MFVIAKDTFFTTDGHRIVRGSVLDAEHELVERFPTMFLPMEATSIEQATRAPGEVSLARNEAKRQRALDGDGDDEGGLDDEGDEGDDEGDDGDEPDLEMPTKSGRKDDWAAYAKANGVDPEGLTRDQIAEKFL